MFIDERDDDEDEAAAGMQASSSISGMAVKVFVSWTKNGDGGLPPSSRYRVVKV